MKNLFESFESKYGVKNSEDQAALNKRAILREGYYDSTVADFLSDLDAIGLDDIDTLEIYSDKATPDYQGDRWSVPEDLLKRTVSSFSANKIYLTVDETSEPTAVNESKTRLKEALQRAHKRYAEAATTRKPLMDESYKPPFVLWVLDGDDNKWKMYKGMESDEDFNKDEFLAQANKREFPNWTQLNNYIDAKIVKNGTVVEEAESDLTQIPGTIAYCLNQNMKEINFGASALELKKTCIDLVTSDSSIPREAVQAFVRNLNNCRNQNALVSTIGTYMTGMKAYH